MKQDARIISSRWKTKTGNIFVRVGWKVNVNMNKAPKTWSVVINGNHISLSSNNGGRNLGKPRSAPYQAGCRTKTARFVGWRWALYLSRTDSVRFKNETKTVAVSFKFMLRTRSFAKQIEIVKARQKNCSFQFIFQQQLLCCWNWSEAVFLL